nr:hypothetical protein CFP56_16671 [Quercus suber]
MTYVPAQPTSSLQILCYRKVESLANACDSCVKVRYGRPSVGEQRSPSHCLALEGEPPTGIAVTSPHPIPRRVLSTSFLLVSLLVDPAQDEPQRPGDDDIAEEICQRDRVAHDVPRPIRGAVQLRADDGAQVADRDLECRGRRSFGLAGDVDRRPAEGHGDGWVDAGGGEEDAHVRNSRTGFGVGVAQKNDVADDAGERGEHDEGRTTPNAFGDVGVEDRQGSGQGVRRNGEQLGGGRRIAERGNDRREEQ